MNNFEIIITDEAQRCLDALAMDHSLERVYKAVSKAIRLMSANLRHPSLATHEFQSKKGPNGEKIFQSYAQNNTPAAYRIFWYYGPNKTEITIFSITPHP